MSARVPAVSLSSSDILFAHLDVRNERVADGDVSVTGCFSERWGDAQLCVQRGEVLVARLQALG